MPLSNQVKLMYSNLLAFLGRTVAYLFAFIVSLCDWDHFCFDLVKSFKLILLPPAGSDEIGTTPDDHSHGNLITPRKHHKTLGAARTPRDALRPEGQAVQQHCGKF